MSDIISHQEGLEIFVTKWPPPSLMMALGMPNFVKIFFKTLHTVMASFVIQAYAFTQLLCNPHIQECTCSFEMKGLVL